MVMDLLPRGWLSVRCETLGHVSCRWWLRCAVPDSGHETALSIPKCTAKPIVKRLCFVQRNVTYGVPQPRKRLLQLCVLGLGLHQDGNVGVGVFPKGKESAVGGARFGNVGCQGVRTREA